MRAYVRWAALPAVIGAVLLTGCSSGGDSKADASKAPSAAPVVDKASSTPSPSSSAPAIPEVGVGGTAKFVAVNPDDQSKTTLSVAVKSVRYVTAAELDNASPPKNGHYAVLTVTVKNVGAGQGRFSPYGAIKWQDKQTAPQEASTMESTGSGQDVDTSYGPGQSVTGDVVVDIPRTGGVVGYFDVPGDPAFMVDLPAS
ncbi:DUF4352 domain-containing protein [Streptomyces sp. NPDC096057]|uniref:DUF4352 domain-containing protein n=1 Tax=Streptomyces sp. NPDC096057 TaxID=3155543 RepID=UPI00331782A6